MAWFDDMFEWSDREPSAYTVSRYTFDCSVAAVQDKVNRVPIVRRSDRRDFAVCGDGDLTRWRDHLWMNVEMVFSDRFRDGTTGDTENWYFQLGQDGTLSVTLPWWPGERLEVEDLTYTSRGGQFLTGFFDSPSGVWHLTISLDRATSDPNYRG